jgi:hypothetical protein
MFLPDQRLRVDVLLQMQCLKSQNVKKCILRAEWSGLLHRPCASGFGSTRAGSSCGSLQEPLADGLPQQLPGSDECSLIESSELRPQVAWADCGRLMLVIHILELNASASYASSCHVLA